MKRFKNKSSDTPESIEVYLKINKKYKRSYKGLKLPIYLSSKFKDQRSEIRNFLFVMSTCLSGVIYFYDFPDYAGRGNLISGLILVFFLFNILFVHSKIKSVFSKHPHKDANAIMFGVLVLVASVNYDHFFKSNQAYSRDLLTYSFVWFFLDVVMHSLKFNGRSILIKKTTISLLRNVNSQLKQTLFFRNEFFKNTPKWDLISFELIFPSFSFLIIYCVLFQVSIEFDLEKASGIRNLSAAIIGTIAVFATTFWHLNDSRGVKYKHAYDQYNKILEARASKDLDLDRVNKIDIWASSLCIDLVQFDLWAHPSFQELFAHHLSDVFYFYENKVIWGKRVEFEDLKTFDNIKNKASKYYFIKDNQFIFKNKSTFKIDDICAMFDFYYHVQSRVFFTAFENSDFSKVHNLENIKKIHSNRNENYNLGDLLFLQTASNRDDVIFKTIVCQFIHDFESCRQELLSDYDIIKDENYNFLILYLNSEFIESFKSLSRIENLITRNIYLNDHNRNKLLNNIRKMLFKSLEMNSHKAS